MTETFTRRWRYAIAYSSVMSTVALFLSILEHR